MDQLRARDIMRRDVVVVQEDAPLAECVHLLCRKHITGVPVVDRTMSMVGIVSQTDLLRDEATLLEALRIAFEGRAVARWEDTGGKRVRDIMRREVICGAEDTPVDGLAKVMLGRSIHRVVITSGRRVAGIVTTVDLARLLAPPSAEAPRAPRPKTEYSNLYSNRHEKLLMRVEHLDRIKELQRRYAAQSLHEHQGSLTVSDVVNASLDFIFEHLPETMRLREDVTFGESLAAGVHRCLLGPTKPALTGPSPTAPLVIDAAPR